jgi:putative SOS response-associated peptidase YedK
LVNDRFGSNSAVRSYAEYVSEEPESRRVRTRTHHVSEAGAERWKDRAAGETIESYTIITTEPNELCAPIHSCMPLILDPND